MKDDEKKLLLLILKYKKTPRDIVAEFMPNLNAKRLRYILNKWDYGGLYDYGVTLDMGWLTTEGIVKANNILTD